MAARTWLPTQPTLPHPAAQGNGPRYLVLWPTAACDLDCIYCYRRDRRGGRMPRDVLHAAIDPVLSEANRTGRPFHIQLAGGEPTLVPEVISEVVERVTAAGFPASYVAIQTNATHITSDLAYHIKEWGIGVGVSLDGPPSIQEQTRGNAKATFAGLINLAAFEVPVRITAVLSAINAEHLDELVLTVSAFDNILGIALDPIVRLGSAADKPDLVPTPPMVRRGVTGMYHAFRLVNVHRRRPLTWRELDTVRNALRGPLPLAGPNGMLPIASTRPYCFAQTGQSIAVGPGGEVFPCSQSVGDPERAAGVLGDIDQVALARFGHTAPLAGPCSQCVLNGRCPGDCPSRIEAAQSTASTHPMMCILYDTIATLDRSL